MDSGRVVQISSRPSILILLTAVLAVSLFLTFAVRDLRAQGESDVLFACASQNSLRLVSDPSECRGNESSVEWNVQGPEGPAGAQGPQGSTDINLHLVDDQAGAAKLDGFIKFNGVVGEATDPGFEGWSRIVSAEQAFSLPAEHGGMIRGRLHFDTFNFIMEFDRVAADLARSMSIGDRYESAEIALVTDTPTGPVAYLSVVLDDVIVADLKIGPTGQSTLAAGADVSLVYSEMKLVYNVLDDLGSVVETTEVDMGEPGR